MSMITATSWVPRGYPAQFPIKSDFDEAEFERIQELANLQLQDARDDLAEAKKTGNRSSGALASKDGNGETVDRTNEDLDDDLKEYDLDNYDTSSDEAKDDEMEDGEEGTRDALGMFGSVKNLAYHASNKDDPYITLQGDDAESDSEREELQVLPTDNLILAARVEDEVAHLEAYVYEDKADNLYVHHDVMLPAIPLCVEWLNAPLKKSETGERQNGNYVAVGTMDPDIEVWDLDMVDSMYPQLILGTGGELGEAEAAGTGKKKRRKKTIKPHEQYHTSSVLSLASNPHHTNLLASASADTTVKLWDLTSATPSVCASSYSHHSDKVCSLSWHPTESTALLSGSYDRTVCAADMRSADNGGIGRRKWVVDSDVETVKWDPHAEHCFFVTTEGGIIYYFDARTQPTSSSSGDAASKPIWRLQAHDEAISAFDINAHIPGFLATGSSDKTVKLWNIPQSIESHGSGTATSGPTLITSRSMAESGRIFSTSFGPDAEVAFRLAVAGSKGNLQIWDTSTNRAVRTTFAGKVRKVQVPAPDVEVRERLTRVADSESSDDEDDEVDGQDGDAIGEMEDE